jgi:hypothetical protein
MDKKFVIKFVGYWVVNTIVLSLANTFFPAAFELGNAYLNTPVAGLFSGLLLTILLFMAKGLARSKNCRSEWIWNYPLYMGNWSWFCNITYKLASAAGI